MAGAIREVIPFVSREKAEQVFSSQRVMSWEEKVEQIKAAEMMHATTHPYSKLLLSSVPKLDLGWLDSLEQDPELMREFSDR